MYSTVETDVLHCSTRKPLLPRAGNPHVSQPEPSWSSETGGGVGVGVEWVAGVGYLASLRKSVPTGSESTRATWLPPGSPIRIQNNRTAPPPDPFFKKKLSYGNSVGEKKKKGTTVALGLDFSLNCFSCQNSPLDVGREREGLFAAERKKEKKKKKACFSRSFAPFVVNTDQQK